MDNGIGICQVPEIGTCIRIPLNREYQNVIESIGAKNILVLTHRTLVELVHETGVEWPKLGDPTVIRWLKEGRKIQVADVDKEGLGARIDLRMSGSSPDTQIISSWNGRIFNIRAACVIGDVRKHFEDVDSTLYAGNYGQPYQGQLIKILKHLQ
jgi:hypothetical protein